MGTQALDSTTDRWSDQRRELHDRRAELVDVSRRDDTEDTSQPVGTLGETEHLAAYEQRQLDAELGAMQRRELAEIDRALAHLDAGTYGTCVGCGTKIAVERLEFLPTAITCVGCQNPPL